MKKQKTLAILFAVILALSTFAMAGCGSDSKSSEVYAVSEKKCNPPITNEEISDNSYNFEDIITQFELAGFTKVSTKIIKDDRKRRNERTKEVSINGKTDFSSEDKFPIDSKVVVSYWVYEEYKEKIDDKSESESQNKSESKSSNTLEESSSANSGEFTVNYKIESDGSATITGFKGEGNSVTINSNYDGHEVKSIGNRAFENCTSLEKVYMFGDPDIGEYSFAGCFSLKSIDIASDTKKIGNHAFENCTSLEKVYMWGNPDIGDYSFAGCSSLKNIDIASDTKKVGNHAFENCTSLEKVYMWGSPDIGDYSFAGCSSLKSIDISSDTKKVGNHAFDGCTNLETVYVWGDKTVFGNDAFANCPKLKDKPE